MEKPPFQFGLKAVFVVMTGAVALLAVWIAAPVLLLSGASWLAMWAFAILLGRFFERLSVRPPQGPKG